eukprot:jgi/Galph1/5810/GphlegSOOS_G4520.1
MVGIVSRLNISRYTFRLFCTRREPNVTSNSKESAQNTKHSNLSPSSLPEHLKNLDIPNDPIFSVENIKDLPREEVQKLSRVFRMIENHAEASEKGSIVKSVENPLSSKLLTVPLRNFPNIPSSVAETFRKEYPAEKIEHLLPQRANSLRSTETRKDDSEKEAVSSHISPRLSHRGREQVDSGISRGFSLFHRVQSKRKVCPLTKQDGTVDIDFRNGWCHIFIYEAKHSTSNPVLLDDPIVNVLKHFVSQSGKILPRRKTGLSKLAQSQAVRAIKIAREMALLHPTMSIDLALQERRKRKEREQAPE